MKKSDVRYQYVDMVELTRQRIHHAETMRQHAARAQALKEEADSLCATRCWWALGLAFCSWWPTT